jgi:carbon storage regulator
MGDSHSSARAQGEQGISSRKPKIFGPKTAAFSIGVAYYQEMSDPSTLVLQQDRSLKYYPQSPRIPGKFSPQSNRMEYGLPRGGQVNPGRSLEPHWFRNKARHRTDFAERKVPREGRPPMLVLSRRSNEKIVLPDLQICVHVLEIKGDRVRLGFEAPPSVTILRGELIQTCDDARAAAPTAPIAVPAPIAPVTPLLRQPSSVVLRPATVKG